MNKIQFILKDLREAQLKAEIPKEKEKIEIKKLVRKIIVFILTPIVMVMLWILESILSIGVFIDDKIKERRKRNVARE